MADAEGKAVVVLTLVPAAGCRAPWQALRKVLKVLLRSFGWKCVRGELLPPPAEEVSDASREQR
jgi:hypothetical protein